MSILLQLFDFKIHLFDILQNLNGLSGAATVHVLKLVERVHRLRQGSATNLEVKRTAREHHFTP